MVDSCLALSKIAFVFLMAASLTTQAATVGVNVGDNFFSPRNLTINANDTVTWTWTGNNPHSSTSNSGLWDSGVKGRNSNFSHTFDSAGNFPYRCIVHSGHDGSIQVQAAANVPPTVSITSPTNGSVFPGPLSGSIQGTASDSDGTVTKVDLFAGDILLGTVANPGPTLTFPVDSVTAGIYELRLIATDNLGATNSSAVVNITVVDPVPIVISTPRLVTPTEFEFSFSSAPGLTYQVRRSPELGQWTVIQTTTATGSIIDVVDSTASGAHNFYSVQLLTNP